MQFRGVWRDYQARVLDELESRLTDPRPAIDDDGDGADDDLSDEDRLERLDAERLHVVAAPGAGKTVLGLEIVRRIGRPALIFAPTTAIREQWAQRLCPLFLDAPPLADEVSRDLASPRPMTLATYQALDALRRREALDELLDTLNRHGRLTLVLDEAHHLRREWWRCLEQLASGLDDVRIVALTATPPFDASFAEWRRYENLCGPIDLEIGIPELVRSGDLCPHQDHVILSAPTADTLALLDERRRAIAELHQMLRGDRRLLDSLEAHPWLARPDSSVEQILERPERLSAALILLASAGRRLPKAPLKLLGVARSDLPLPSAFWLERLLDGLIGKGATFAIGDDWSRPLARRLHRDGLIEGGRVRLHQTRSIFRLLASSLAKLDSIVEIARSETACLGSRLRMVILSDQIRADALPASPEHPFRPAKLGVVPIFETLRRAGIAKDGLGVLTGSLVMIPRATRDGIAAAAAQIGLDPQSIRGFDLPSSPDHLRLETSAGGAADLVRLVTELFSRGEIRILIGTQSLLGEGWDAPAVNSLVLASNTASFMLSNQMRGRAIRRDPADSGKVSNIWHLATIEADAGNPLAEAAAMLNWGHLNDDGLGGLSDAALLRRRFLAFEGISNGDSTLIESGIGRLGIAAGEAFDQANRRSFALASDRAAIASRWSQSLGEGTPQARVRETAAPSYAPRQLAFYDTLQALAKSGPASGALAAAEALRDAQPDQGAGLIALGLAGAAALASLPKLTRAAWLVWRNGSLEGSLKQVGRTILIALHDADLVSDEELALGRFEVRTSIDGRKDIVVVGVRRSTERKVMQAIAELLGPVENPRYLLVRHSWLGLRKRSDYHAVPAAVGARQEHAERFAALFEARVGSSRLVYTRTPQGRRTLLRARAKSLAAGFQRAVDRRSAWL